jgi:LemA protein
MSAGYVILVLLGVIGYFIAIYNKLVSLRTGIDAAWSDIDIQLKRRYNLIPALIEVVKSYKAYESETLEEIVKARQLGTSATSVEEQVKATKILGVSLGKLFALSEAYPDLKADTHFLKLQTELTNLEGSIQNARRYYNAIVRDYNAKVASFPDMLIAQKFDFTVRDYFELDDSEADHVKQMPKVKI